MKINQINHKLYESQNYPPLVTFFLFSYNQRKYIEDACRAALAQTYTPLEIIFSDDFSSDGTFELIEGLVKEYNGPHTVKLNRNNINLGLIGHVNKSFEISSGDLIVVAAGDDISSPDRVKCLMDVYQQRQNKTLVIHSSAMKINDVGCELGIFIPPIIDQPMTPCELADCQSLYIGATAAWSRTMYKEFGPIVFHDAYEDLVLGFRAAIKDSLIYVDKPLVRYRVGFGMSTKSLPLLFKISSRVSIREKKLKMALDVYRQRRSDMDCIEERAGDVDLKYRLLKNITIQNKRLLFYKDPLLLFFQIFSKDFVFVLRAFKAEFKYLIGLNRWL